MGGAERIRGELLKRGIRVAKRTVQRHMTKVRITQFGRAISWKPMMSGFELTHAFFPVFEPPPQ